MIADVNFGPHFRVTDGMKFDICHMTCPIALFRNVEEIIHRMAKTKLVVPGKLYPE